MNRIHPATRLLAAVCLLLLYCACSDKSETAEPAPVPRAWEGTIVAVGDSLTAGLGVAEEAAYPARLQQKLLDAGYRYQVINAGISGETSSGLRSRIEWVLTLAPDIVIIETGANDGFRGIAPELIRKNLEETVDILQQKGITVVLAGMQMVRNLGEAYTRDFAGIYSAVARSRELIFMPFFLEGVAGEDELNQADGIHPTEQGYVVVVERLFPYVVQAVRQKQSKRTEKPIRQES